MEVQETKHCIMMLLSLFHCHPSLCLSDMFLFSLKITKEAWVQTEQCISSNHKTQPWKSALKMLPKKNHLDKYRKSLLNLYMHGMQLYIYIQHKARHILENSGIWWDFVNCLDCISNSKYEYEDLSPSVFCITNSNYFRCLPEHGVEQACLEACVVYRGKQKE